jgi:glycosyltransferase involved in cell wall biosynthesis
MTGDPVSSPARPRARAGGSAPVHVLTLLDHLVTTGGAERLALEIATRLDPARFRSTLCASRFAPSPAMGGDEAQVLARVEQAGIGFLALGREGRASVWPWRRLAAYLRRERVDVLHAHMFGSSVWGTIIGRLARVPVVVAHEHTWSFEGEPVKRLLDRELIGRFSDAFIAVSQADRQKMIEIERIAPERIRFIPNGISPKQPTPGRDLRAELELGSGPLIGAVGTLRAQKSYDVLIRASAVLRTRHPGLKVLIAGGGPEKERLEALIAELGLTEVVRLLGRRLDVPDILAALDVAVSSSSFEGSPLSVMEYMEAGLPIAATRVGGVPDLIEHGVGGLLVEPNEPLQLADAVSELLGDRERARALGARSQVRRRAEFDLDVMVGNLEALYTELLERRGRMPAPPASR